MSRAFFYAGFIQVGADYVGTSQEAALVKMRRATAATLSDHETRRKLLNLLPSLVSHFGDRHGKKRYRIVNHAGEMSAWRQPTTEDTGRNYPRSTFLDSRVTICATRVRAR